MCIGPHGVRSLMVQPELPANWAGVRVAVTQSGLGGRQDDHALVSADRGFNLGDHVGDEPAAVFARRQALELELGAPILWLNQVHGCEVAQAAAERLGQAVQADASVSTSPTRALAIMTADCLPVVFTAFDRQGQALGVGAAHAGWRGLHAGVLQACLSRLAQACSVPPSQIQAWMGPAIGPLSFEVGAEVRAAFVDQHPGNQVCFTAQNDGSGKYLADIYGLARLALLQAGCSQVLGGGQDTFTNANWYSHRRWQKGLGPNGRQATLIRLLP